MYVKLCPENAGLVTDNAIFFQFTIPKKNGLKY